MEGKACDNCFQVGNFGVTSGDVLFCDVTITHPFPGHDEYTAFDPRMILITGSDFTFPESGHSISWNGDHIKLLYADGYTNLFNPTDFPVDLPVPDALKYTPGILSPGGDLSATLNPYLAFNRTAERRIFYSAEASTEKLMMKLPDGPLEFGYAVDVCWTPVEPPVNNPLEDFPPEANCREAYQIYVHQGVGLTDLTGSEASVQVEIRDHQGIDTVSTVLMEAPDLFSGLIELNLSTTMDEKIIFTGLISNDNGAGIGDYPVLTRVIDFDEDENLGPIDGWNVTNFKITELGYPLNDLIYIPAGEFFMGVDPANWPSGFPWSEPGHMNETEAYLIGKYEVTCREYSLFIAAGGYYNPEWWSEVGWEWRTLHDKTEPLGWNGQRGDHTPDLPVSSSYYEAVAFCTWAGGRLPTEVEWERAARGEDHRLYPWGNVWDPNKSTTTANPEFWLYRIGQACPVGIFSPEGDSPYGLADCAGNSFEMTSSWASEWDDLEFYIYGQWAGGNPDPIPDPNPGDPLRKVMRGHSYSGDEITTLTFARLPSPELSTGGGTGFRIVFDTD
jgi:hypothetical protein